MALSSAGFPLIAPVILSVGSLESLGMEIPNLLGNAASSAAFAANDAFYLPFRLSQPYTVAEMFHFNGSTVNGNLDVGIYDVNGVRLVSSGAVAQSGTTVLQTFNITDTVLSPGRYYMAVSYSSNTATGLAVGSTVGTQRAAGILFQATAHPLPATATFAAPSITYVPVIGFSMKTII